MDKYRNTLLISEDFVKTNSTISENLESKFISTAIRKTQEMYLPQVLFSKALYQKLQLLVYTDDIYKDKNVAYKDLLDEIQFYLVSKTLLNIIPLVNNKTSNMGTYDSTDERVATKDYKAIADMYTHDADHYANSIQEYLIANKEKFEELDGKCIGCEKTSASTGLWLGAKRGYGASAVRPIENIILNSEGGDYNEGYEDGKAEQKAKLTSLNVTENGTYTREDGYNEVTVNVEGGDDKTIDHIYSDTGNSWALQFPDGSAEEDKRVYLEGWNEDVTIIYTDDTSKHQDGVNYYHFYLKNIGKDTVNVNENKTITIQPSLNCTEVNVNVEGGSSDVAKTVATLKNENGDDSYSVITVDKHPYLTIYDNMSNDVKVTTTFEDGRTCESTSICADVPKKAFHRMMRLETYSELMVELGADEVYVDTIDYVMPWTESAIRDMVRVTKEIKGALEDSSKDFETYMKVLDSLTTNGNDPSNALFIFPKLNLKGRSLSEAEKDHLQRTLGIWRNLIDGRFYDEDCNRWYAMPKSYYLNGINAIEIG